MIKLKYLISEILMESRESDFKKKYQSLPSNIQDRIIKNDPSSNGKYLDWMGKIVSTEKSLNLDDFLKNVNEFNKYSSSLGDIYKLKSYSDLKHILSSRQKSKKEITKEGAKILIDDDNFQVVVPTTWESCRYYGNNTRWCIVGKESWWNKYYYQNSILIVLDKRNDEKYAVIGNLNGDIEVYDSHDQPLPYDSFSDPTGEDFWPEYLQNTISQWISNDDVESRKNKHQEEVINDYIREYGTDQIWRNYLETIHTEFNIDKEVNETSLISFKNIAHKYKVLDEDLEDFALDYLYNQFFNMEMEGDVNYYLGDVKSFYDFEDSLSNHCRNEKYKKLKKITDNYIHSIAGVMEYLEMIKNSVGEQSFNKLYYKANLEVDLFNALTKYNGMLNSPKQRSLKGIRHGKQSVQINNIKDIIKVFKRTGYESIAYYLESVLGIIAENYNHKLKTIIRESIREMEFE